MGPVQSIKTCLRKYATFSGRASRSEFWWFTSFLVVGLYFVASVETKAARLGNTEHFATLAIYLVFFVPSLSATFRRLHDMGRRGINAFEPIFVLIPYGIAYVVLAYGLLHSSDENASGWLIGMMIVNMLFGGAFLISFIRLVFRLSRPSYPGSNKYGPGSNQYGPNPHEVTP